MKARYFDPAKDTFDQISKLNDFPPEFQDWMGKQYREWACKHDIILLEDDNKLVGLLHIFDSGFPWVILDGLWLHPDYRGHRTQVSIRAMFDLADKSIGDRGIRWIGMTAESKFCPALIHHLKFMDIGKEYKFLVKVL
jgi:hypothetical protein